MNVLYDILFSIRIFADWRHYKLQNANTAHRLGNINEWKYSQEVTET